MAINSRPSARFCNRPWASNHLVHQRRGILNATPHPSGCAIEDLEQRQLLSAAPAALGITPAETGNTLQVLVGSAANQFRFVSFTDAAGVARTFSLKGSGAAAVNFTGTGLQTAKARGGGESITGTGIGIDTIALSGTSARTAVTFAAGNRRAPGGPLAVAGLTANSPIGSITGNVDLTGPVTVTGSIGKLQVNGLTGGSVSTTTTDPITGLPVTTSTPASFSAGSIGSITDAGNLGENFVVGGAIGKVTVRGNLTGSISATQIKSLAVSGNVTGSTITLSQPLSRRGTDLGRLDVTGTVSGTTLTSAGNLGPITTAGLSGDNFYAGTTLSTANAGRLPTTLGELPSQASIASVKTRSTTATNIAAFTVGPLTLGALRTDNAGVQFGVAGASIARITGTASVNGKKFNFGRIRDQSGAQTDLSKAGLTGTDFIITVL